MMKFIFTSLLILLTYFSLPMQIKSETMLEIYMNDFYSKSEEAGLILKEIENNLKEGSRKKVCSRQKEAAKLGLSANKSLIKAFEASGTKPPIEAINASQKRWESILNNC